MENNQGEYPALWEWYYSEHPELLQREPALNNDNNTEPEPMELDPPTPPAQDWPTRYVEFDNGEGAWLYDETAIPFCVAPHEMMQYQDVPMPAMPAITNSQGPVMASGLLPGQPTPEANAAYNTIDSEPGMPPRARTHPCPLGCGKSFFHAGVAARHTEKCSMAAPSTQRTKSFPCPANAYRGCERMFFSAGVARKHGEVCAQRYPCPNNVDGINGCTKLFKYEVQATRHATVCNGKSRAEQARARQDNREAAARRLSLRSSPK